MTTEELSVLNDKFQNKASQLADLLPGSNLLEYSSSMIRSAQKMDKLLGKVLSAKGQISFFNQMDALEEEMDELIYMIDKLDSANKKKQIPTITDFVKKGYELLSLYSICCDQIIEKKMKNQDKLD